MSYDLKGISSFVNKKIAYKIAPQAILQFNVIKKNDIPTSF